MAPAKAGQTGGTRIGAAIKEFVDTAPARGAVALVVSDGVGHRPARSLGREMRRRTGSSGPTRGPLVGGMAAARPYCDALLSAHSRTALDGLLAALACTRR